MAKKLLFATVFISIAIAIGIAGYLFFVKQQPALAQIVGENIYISQSGNGSQDGSDCNNAHPVLWFNTVGNWANPKQSGKIGPGDTVHLCGVITATLNVRGSGAFGNPITVYFEPDARVSLPAGTLMNISSKNYIIVDGGINGILENTDNGTMLGKQMVASGIYAPSAGNLEVKNLTIQNLYVHTSVSDSSLDFTVGGGIYLNNFGSNISIHDSTFHDICWVIIGGSAAGASGFNVYNNNFYNYDHAIGGVGGAMASPANVNIGNNHFGSTANWDTIANKYHHDGIHIYFGAGGLLSGVNIYNNLFDGDWGINNTAHIFLEGDYTHANRDAMSNFTIYNNIFIQYAGNYLNVGFFSGGGPNWSLYNNTFLGSGVKNSSCVGIRGPGFTFKNNIVSGCTTFLSANTTTSFAVGGLDNNIYANATTGGNPPWFYNSTIESTFSAWKSAAGQDVNSFQVSSANLSVDGHLLLGSSAIDAGADLASLAITTLNLDKDSISRPQGPAWDIGAYEYIQTPPPLKGDFNSDSKVNDLDFTSFKNAFKSLFNAIFDLNSDNAIDVKDLGVLMSGWLP